LTRPIKKKKERIFVEEAARLLGKPWILGADQEHPDFIVTDGKRQFGLEVCEIFIGPQDHSGSAMKKKESSVQRCINALQREYEANVDVPLIVKFVGNAEAMGAENLATVVPALVAQDLPSKPTGYRFVYDTSLVCPMRSKLRVHVTKALRPDWYSVNYRVGFVDRNPKDIIAIAIEKKAKELKRYKETAGLDIRLLLVADAIHNSGKLRLRDPGAFDLHGFQAVYLFTYPESMVKLASDTPWDQG
jgi:hypothetical protein